MFLWHCPPEAPPQVTPNDTQRHFSARIWAYRRPGLCHPTRPNRAKAPVLSDQRRSLAS